VTAVGTGDGSPTGSKAPEACLAAQYGSSDEVIVPVVQLSVSVADRASFDPVGDSFSGFQFGELAFGALGVLAISTEYGTGLIRSTLAAVPSRRQVFATKTLVLGTFARIVCEVCAFASFFLGQAVLSGRGLDVRLSQADVLRAVSFAGIYMAVVTMVGFGLGAVIRHTSGAMAAMVALVFLAWPAVRAMESFTSLPDRMLLVNAADALTAIHSASGAHPERIPSFGFACLDLVLYLATFLGLAPGVSVAMRKQDPYPTGPGLHAVSGSLRGT
jgi:ABC-2 type transport system permease protein